MYKVFFNDKLIVLANKGETITGRNKEVINFNDVSGKDLRKKIFQFIENDGENSLVIESENVEALFTAFKSIFKPVDAAGGMVRDKENRLLCIYRHGVWDLPKGKLEKNEEPGEGAIREVMEECGIGRPAITGNLPETYHIYFHKEKWILKRTFWYKMFYAEKQNLVPQTEEGITKAVWFEGRELPAIMDNTYESLKDLFRAAF